MSEPCGSRDLVSVDVTADGKLRLFQFLHSLGKSNDLKEFLKFVLKIFKIYF